MSRFWSPVARSVLQTAVRENARCGKPASAIVTHVGGIADNQVEFTLGTGMAKPTKWQCKL